MIGGKAAFTGVPNRPSRASSIPDAFTRLAQAQPEAVAVQTRERLLTYGELDVLSDRLALRLLALGLEKEGCAGVLAQRGHETVVAALAAMKAGGAYVPLDPESPPLRVRRQLADARASVVLAPSGLAHLVGDAGLPAIALDPGLELLAHDGGGKPGVKVARGDLCAVVFTSGSSGDAKGVALEHGNLLNLLERARDLSPEPGEGALHVCAPQFDVAAYEIWAALLSGARLVCHPPGRPDPADLARTIAGDDVNWSTMPTSVFHQLAESCPDALAGMRMVIVAGETLLPHYARRVWEACPQTRLINAYGPAESTVFVSADEIGEEIAAGQPVPIGFPVAGAELVVLDERGRGTARGERGELYIGGPGVARGYLHRPDLTAERFTAATDGRLSQRLYRTGDLVREREDGELEILGRSDDQVKLSGYRVEPREVEAELAALPSVRQAAAVIREDVPGLRRLVAYVVFADGHADEGKLRESLAERVPSYMLPSAIVAMDSLPLTSNDKLDRRALPPPPASPRRVPAEPEPRDSALETVLSVFREVLGTREVSGEDDFFELGGNSLLAVQVLVRLRESIGLELPLAAVFEARSAGVLARRMATARRAPGPPPLTPRTHPGAVPASAAQAKALLVSELADESLPYQSQSLHRIVGWLDVDALQRSLSVLVRRHEILRTTFAVQEGRWVQQVHQPWDVLLPVQDLRFEQVPEQALQSAFAELHGQRLDPRRLPLIRWSLARTDDSEYALMSVEHHALHDGVSTAILLEELAALYTAELERGAPELARPAVQYRDFVAWQDELVESDFGAAQLEYWRERLREAPRALEIPIDHPRPSRQTYRGATLREALPAGLVEAIEQRALDWGASTFSLMLAAYASLLARYAGSEEFVVGSGLANRRTLASEQLLGMLVNTVALRIDLKGEPGARELVDRVQATVLEAHDHQDVPFEHVVRHVAPARSASTAPLYQTLFSFHDAPVRTLSLPGAAFIPGDVRPNGSAKADLSVIVINRRSHAAPGRDVDAHERLAEDGLTIVWEYNSDLFAPSTAARMLGAYRELLEQFAAGAHGAVGPPALGHGERRRAAIAGRPTSYERDGTIAGVFSDRAAETPHAVALSAGGQQLTYSQLERRSNRLAHRLLSMGIGRRGRVGVCLERSPEMIVAYLAVLKAGAAYVPLDPADPRERIERQARTAQVELMLSVSSLKERMPGPLSRLVCLDDEIDLAREPDIPPVSPAGALDPAYVMFTSGSTGAPKGVEVPHRAVLRLVRGADYVALGPREVMLCLAPAAFDASTFEIWGALLNGGRLALAPPGPLSLRELQDVVTREEVSTLWLTAGLLHQVVDGRPEILGSLRQLLAGGDVLSPDHVRRALQALPADAALINGYGPTEATTFTCTHRLRRGERLNGTVPIGAPIANSHVYILDGSGDPVPAGVSGELHVGGDGLALGYAGEPGLTAERFVADPFDPAEGARMYRTGDLVRERADGLIEFEGRADRQLKIRGFRVEPGEVEEALRSHPAVVDAFVAAHGAEGDALAAYVVAARGNPPRLEALRAHAARILPPHAVPTAWALVERMPLTPSGKVDRGTLPVPSTGVLARDGGRAGAGSRPADELELMLTSIWCSALGTSEVNPDDDFFDLGGHSLMAVELFDRIANELGVEVPLASIFEAPTVRGLADLIRQDGWRPSRDALVTLTRTGRRPALFMVAAGDGNSVGFGALARRLGEDQPFYALAPRGMNGGAPLHTSVQAMAAHYIRRIRTVQPHGPYHLGGRCLGSLVAYEMACRLEAAGDEVALLVVLDSGGPLWKPRPLADGTPFDEIMNRALRRSGAHEQLGDVFSPQGTERLLSWLSEPVALGAGGGQVNRYLYEVQLVRSDVRDAYAQHEDGGAAALVEWAWTSGRRELNLAERLLPDPVAARSRAPLSSPGPRERTAELASRASWRAREAADLVSRGRLRGAAARRRERLRTASHHAADSYRAGRYGGEITLIRSAEFEVHGMLERWHALDTGGVREHVVPGTHRSALREPDVAGLAHCIRGLVDELG